MLFFKFFFNNLCLWLWLFKAGTPHVVQAGLTGNHFPYEVKERFSWPIPRMPWQAVVIKINSQDFFRLRQGHSAPRWLEEVENESNFENKLFQSICPVEEPDVSVSFSLWFFFVFFWLTLQHTRILETRGRKLDGCILLHADDKTAESSASLSGGLDSIFGSGLFVWICIFSPAYVQFCSVLWYPYYINRLCCLCNGHGYRHMNCQRAENVRCAYVTSLPQKRMWSWMLPQSLTSSCK